METEREVTFVRIYLHEADHGRRHNLMEEILSALCDQHGVSGVTVFRGIAGLDDSGQIQSSDLLRLMVDLPLVIEFYDEPEVVRGVIRTLNGLIAGHPVLSWPANVTMLSED
jgi:PII-like signaling protein